MGESRRQIQDGSADDIGGIEMRACIKREECIGCQFCTDVAPDVFRMNGESAEYIFGSITARHTIVDDQLFLDISRRLFSCQKIHRRLQGDLSSFYVAREEHFLQRHHRQRLGIWVVFRFIFKQRFYDFFARRDHFFCCHIPVRFPVTAVQRQKKCL